MAAKTKKPGKKQFMKTLETVFPRGKGKKLLK
jgi:hypothetical protein